VDELLKEAFQGLSDIKENLEKEKKSMEKYKYDDVLELNVGGDQFTTYKSTLVSTITEGSMLSAMFSGRHALKQDPTGRYFLDRPPEPFRWIINTLRTGECITPESTFLRKQIIIELEFFGLVHPLFEPILIGKYFETNPSLSLTDKEMGTLVDWIGTKSLELLFRASRDGWDGNNFHSRCVHKGPTLVIAETACGYIIGGYTKCKWNSNNIYSNAQNPTDTWIFSFRYSGNGKPATSLATSIDQNSSSEEGSEEEESEEKTKQAQPVAKPATTVGIRLTTTQTMNHIIVLTSFGPVFGDNDICIDVAGMSASFLSTTFPGTLIGKSTAMLKELEIFYVKE